MAQPWRLATVIAVIRQAIFCDQTIAVPMLEAIAYYVGGHRY